MIIEWVRVARPQDDQYDTSVTLDLATGALAPQSTPHQRRAVGHSPTIFDGTVAVRYIASRCPGYPHYTHAPLSHSNINLAVDLVRRWPSVFRQFQLLMDSFHPMFDARIPPSKWGLAKGSSSHSDENKFGTLYATIYDPVALAEAFVHEMAHNKLRGLGIYMESAQRLILNAPDELLESPIRKDCLRPMTAVFHAQYSFMYVTNLDLRIVEAEPNPENRMLYLSYLSYNLPRMEFGHEQVKDRIRVDEDGKAFLNGFLDWSEDVFEQGNRLLQTYRVPKIKIEPVFKNLKTGDLE